MLNSFYLDASALAKRYIPETGSGQVDTILDTVSLHQLFVLSVSAGEVVSILVRKRNAALISVPEFDQALLNFNAEIAEAAHVTRVPVRNRLAIASFPLIIAHSINSTDAITAQEEGLITFNPESQDQAALAALMTP